MKRTLAALALSTALMLAPVFAHAAVTALPAQAAVAAGVDGGTELQADSLTYIIIATIKSGDDVVKVLFYTVQNFGSEEECKAFLAGKDEQLEGALDRLRAAVESQIEDGKVEVSCVVAPNQ